MLQGIFKGARSGMPGAGGVKHPTGESTGGLFHGTSVADLIAKEGFKLAPVKNGSAYGSGVYLTMDKSVAAQYGDVLEVTCKVPVKDMTQKEFDSTFGIDGLKSTVDSLMEEDFKKRGMAKLMAEPIDYSIEARDIVAKKLGIQAIHISNPTGLGGNPLVVVFDPANLVVNGKVSKSDVKYYLAVLPKGVKKIDFQSIFKGARSGMPGAGGVKHPTGELSTDVIQGIKEYTARGGPLAGNNTASPAQRESLATWLSQGKTGEDKTLYQGTAFSNKEWESNWQSLTTEGNTIELKSQSFSEDRTRTGGYKGGEQPVKFILEGGMTGRDIQKDSVYPVEKEHLAAKGNKYTVLGWDVYPAGIHLIRIKQVSEKKSDFQSIFKGARSGQRGAGGVLWPKNADGTYPVGRIKQSFAELSTKGVQIGYTAEDFHEKTQGKVDPVDLVKAIWGTDEYANNQMSDVRITENPGGVNNEHNEGKVSISGAGKLHGADIVLVERNLEHDMSSIEHTYLKLMPGSDGAGAVKKMFASAVPYYKDIGLQGITTHANLEAGGYAWTKYGFTHDDPADYKAGIGNGWKKITDAANAGIPKEYRTPLSKEAKAEMDTLREVLDKGDERMGQVLTSIKTPNLDKHFGHTYRGLTPEIPAHVPLNFIKVASYYQHWLGRHTFDDAESAKRLQDYLFPNS